MARYRAASAAGGSRQSKAATYVYVLVRRRFDIKLKDQFPLKPPCQAPPFSVDTIKSKATQLVSPDIDGICALIQPVKEDGER